MTSKKVDLLQVRIQELNHRIEQTEKRMARNQSLIDDMKNSNKKLRSRIDGFQSDIELAKKEIALIEEYKSKTNEKD